MSEEKLELAEEHTAVDPMNSIRENMRPCMQCGTCTGSCGSAYAWISPLGKCGEWSNLVWWMKSLTAGPFPFVQAAITAPCAVHGACL